MSSVEARHKHSQVTEDGSSSDVEIMHPKVTTSQSEEAIATSQLPQTESQLAIQSQTEALVKELPQHPTAYPIEAINTAKAAQNDPCSDTERNAFGDCSIWAQPHKQVVNPQCLWELPMAPPLAFCRTARGRLDQAWDVYTRSVPQQFEGRPDLVALPLYLATNLRRCILAVWWKTVVDAGKPPPFKFRILFPKFGPRKQSRQLDDKPPAESHARVATTTTTTSTKIGPPGTATAGKALRDMSQLARRSEDLLATTTQDPAAYPLDMIATLRQAQRQEPSETEREHIGTSHYLTSPIRNASYCDHPMSVIANGPLGPNLIFSRKAGERLFEVWNRYAQDSLYVPLPTKAKLHGLYRLQIHRCHLAVWWNTVVSARRPPPFELSILFPKIYLDPSKKKGSSRHEPVSRPTEGPHHDGASTQRVGPSTVSAPSMPQTPQSANSSKKKKKQGRPPVQVDATVGDRPRATSGPNGTASLAATSGAGSTPHKTKEHHQDRTAPSRPAAQTTEPQPSEPSALAVVESQAEPGPSSPQTPKKRKRDATAPDLLEELLYKACETDDADVRKEMKAFVEKQLRKQKRARRKSEGGSEAAARDEDYGGDEDMRELLLSSLTKDSADVRQFARSFYEQRRLQK